MSRPFVIAGTDTDVGKTVFAAGLTNAIGAVYWKPVQCGIGDDGGDAEVAQRLAELDPSRLELEAYRFDMPASPHRAAEAENIEIDVELVAEAGAQMLAKHSHRGLVIEGAGGLLVPLTRNTLQIDLFARWNLPIILCARTTLGTINHTLLSIEAIRRRSMPLHGIAFIGDANDDSERTICEMGNARRLGRLPRIAALSPETLREAFAANFRREDFA